MCETKKNAIVAFAVPEHRRPEKYSMIVILLIVPLSNQFMLLFFFAAGDEWEYATGTLFCRRDCCSHNITIVTYVLTEKPKIAPSIYWPCRTHRARTTAFVANYFARIGVSRFQLSILYYGKFSCVSLNFAFFLNHDDFLEILGVLPRRYYM